MYGSACLLVLFYLSLSRGIVSCIYLVIGLTGSKKHLCDDHTYTSGNSNLADLPPSIEHRCLEYCYTKLGRSTPPSIEHRCLECCYTKLGRSTPDLPADLPHQSNIDALNTVTPNLADLPQICWLIYPPIN